MESETSGVLSEVREFLRGLSGVLPAFAAAPVPVRTGGGHEAYFHERASFWAGRLGVTFGRVRVKGQRSLWGSCTRRGDLNFNWRLTLAPPEVLDYVVVHELAHRREMNHSRRFWDLVELHCPDHKAHRRWLRRNGPDLYRRDGGSPRA